MSKTNPVYWVYLLASKPRGTLYVGVTNDLSARVYQHKIGDGAVFTRKYGVDRLVWMEPFDDIEAAIAQEKRLKRWHRAWKIKIIEERNPDWTDLYETLND